MIDSSINYILESDPTEAAHDGYCPLCDSKNITFVKERGTFAVNIMYEGKLCQRVRKMLWLCEDCDRAFVCNQFITQQ